MKNDDPICDEEIHALNEEYGYILGFFERYSTEIVEDKSIEFLNKYSNYIYENDKEFTKQILLSFFYENKPEDIEFILREPHLVSPLRDKFSLALKFKRHEKDNI